MHAHMLVVVIMSACIGVLLKLLPFSVVDPLWAQPCKNPALFKKCVRFVNNTFK